MLGRLARMSVIPWLLALAGCGVGDSARAPSGTVAVTNVVEVVRVVTNEVVVAVTNVVEGMPERILSARKTAPYIVASSALDETRMRRLLSEVGARVIECGDGSVAEVEAPDRAVAMLAGIASVKALAPEDKVSAEAGERVRVLPLSLIDSSAVVKAIGDLGGEVAKVETAGRPAIHARLPPAAIRKLAERGDVRRIERDDK